MVGALALTIGSLVEVGLTNDIKQKIEKDLTQSLGQVTAYSLIQRVSIASLLYSISEINSIVTFCFLFACTILDYINMHLRT